MVLSAYLVLGREGWSETARTRGGGHPGVLGDDEDDAEGDEVKIEVGKTRFGFYLDNMSVPYLYLDQILYLYHICTWTRSRLSKVVGRF